MPSFVSEADVALWIFWNGCVCRCVYKTVGRSAESTPASSSSIFSSDGVSKKARTSLFALVNSQHKVAMQKINAGDVQNGRNRPAMKCKHESEFSVCLHCKRTLAHIGSKHAIYSAGGPNVAHDGKDDAAM